MSIRIHPHIFIFSGQQSTRIGWERSEISKQWKIRRNEFREHVDLKRRPVKFAHWGRRCTEKPQINYFMKLTDSKKWKYTDYIDFFKEGGGGRKRKKQLKVPRHSLDTCFYLRKDRQNFWPETYITHFFTAIFKIHGILYFLFCLNIKYS